MSLSATSARWSGSSRAIARCTISRSCSACSASSGRVGAPAALPSFRFDSKVSTWIYRISKNHCLNRLKYLERRGRGRSDGLDGVPEEALASAAGSPIRPDEELQARHERELVQRAIARLEPDQRALVALRDIEGLSYEEMVEITQLPLGTVKSRLHRAREKLAEFLSEEIPEGENA